MAQYQFGNFAVPGWLFKTIIGGLITALIGGAATWGSSITFKAVDHEKRISVVEDHQKTRDKEIDTAIGEIKASQLRVEAKLDNALQRNK